MSRSKAAAPGSKATTCPACLHPGGRHQGKIAHVGADIPENLPRVQEAGHQGGFIAFVVMPEEVDLALFGVLQVQLHLKALVQGYGEQTLHRPEARDGISHRNKPCHRAGGIGSGTSGRAMLAHGFERVRHIMSYSIVGTIPHLGRPRTIKVQGDPAGRPYFKHRCSRQGSSRRRRYRRSKSSRA